MHRQIAAVFAASVAFASQAQQGLDPAVVAAEIEARFRHARYLEGMCEEVTTPGWEGFATKRCSYEVVDKVTRTRKKGWVIMLNPSPLQMSKWFINACATVRPRAPARACVRLLSSQVRSQSGGQFPIAGVVYEDLFPADGVFEAYAFMDGVTVINPALRHRNTSALTQAQLEAVLNGKARSTVTQEAPARIIGVTRTQYLKSNPEAQVSGLNWLAVVAAEHKAAMQSDRHALIEAWLRSSP